jgi:hypothetical protein
MSTADTASSGSVTSAVKCACESCHCLVPPGKGVMREGKLYCSSTCAYDCTKTTCLCVHNGCAGTGTLSAP